ncbi:hypothetical protein GQR36_27420 [Enterococcus termitis]
MKKWGYLLCGSLLLGLISYFSISGTKIEATKNSEESSLIETSTQETSEVSTTEESKEKTEASVQEVEAPNRPSRESRSVVDTSGWTPFGSSTAETNKLYTNVLGNGDTLAYKFGEMGRTTDANLSNTPVYLKMPERDVSLAIAPKGTKNLTMLGGYWGGKTPLINLMEGNNKISLSNDGAYYRQGKVATEFLQVNSTNEVEFTKQINVLGTTIQTDYIITNKTAADKTYWLRGVTGIREESGYDNGRWFSLGPNVGFRTNLGTGRNGYKNIAVQRFYFPETGKFTDWGQGTKGYEDSEFQNLYSDVTKTVSSNGVLGVDMPVNVAFIDDNSYNSSSKNISAVYRTNNFTIPPGETCTVSRQVQLTGIGWTPMDFTFNQENQVLYATQGDMLKLDGSYKSTYDKYMSISLNSASLNQIESFNVTADKTTRTWVTDIDTSSLAAGTYDVELNAIGDFTGNVGNYKTKLVIRVNTPPVVIGKSMYVKKDDVQAINGSTVDYKTFLEDYTDDATDLADSVVELVSGQDIPTLVSTIGKKTVILKVTDGEGASVDVTVPINVLSDKAVISTERNAAIDYVEDSIELTPTEWNDLVNNPTQKVYEFLEAELHAVINNDFKTSIDTIPTSGLEFTRVIATGSTQEGSEFDCDIQFDSTTGLVEFDNPNSIGIRIKVKIKDVTPPTATDKTTTIKLGDINFFADSDNVRDLVDNLADNVSSVPNIDVEIKPGQNTNTIATTLGRQPVILILTDEAGNSSEVTMYVDVVDGVLSITSAPTVIDFGKLVLGIFDLRVEKADYNMPFIINDDRYISNDWRITAELVSPLTNGTETLNNAIRYRKGSDINSEVVLTDAAEEIFQILMLAAVITILVNIGIQIRQGLN